MLARRQFALDLPYLLKAAGALGTLIDGAKEHGLMTMSGSPNRVSPLPNLVISHEDYALFEPAHPRQGDAAASRARSRTRSGRKPVQQWNTVAEIRGSERPGQVVILGAHLDSWDLGTGTTDNGTGSMVVLEAARAIAQSGSSRSARSGSSCSAGRKRDCSARGPTPRRMRRRPTASRRCWCWTTAPGAITGQALQGRDELAGLWKPLLAPVASLGADSVRDANKAGTDHLSFLPYGVPGFNFDQLPRGYYHTHHSQSDTYDKAVPGDLKQASAVMAVTALELANLPEPAAARPEARAGGGTYPAVVSRGGRRRALTSGARQGHGAGGVEPAARVVDGGDGEPPRPQHAEEVLGDLGRGVLLEDADAAVAGDVVLEALELDAAVARHVARCGAWRSRAGRCRGRRR